VTAPAKPFSVPALPTHRPFGAILGAVLIACYLLVLVLFRDPLGGLVMTAPLIALFAAIYVPYYLDHAGVAYELDETSILLRRHGKIRRRIPFADIRSVGMHHGVIILRRRNILRGTIHLHPETGPKAEMLFRIIRKIMEGKIS
jgi:hypothetical protein